MDPWHLLVHGPADAATNMAVDEALLPSAARRGIPLLRVYRWQRPTVSIGYFQKYPVHLEGTHAIVRRPTGGGLVYHGEDTTYTVIAPPGHSLHQLPVADAYRALHEAIAAALASTAGLRATAESHPSATAEAEKTRAYECFQNPVEGDVVVDGRKLAGAAQRRSRWGMLHQGSIAALVSVEQLVDGFRAVLGVEFQPYELTPEERALADQLAAGKYGTEPWNRRVT